MSRIPRLSGWLKQELRLIVVFLGMVAAVSAVVAFQAGLHQRQQLLGAYQIRLGYVTHTRNDILRQQFDQLRRDALFLSATPPVSGIVRAASNRGLDTRGNTSVEAWKKQLGAIFDAFLEANPDLTAIRLIGVADDGRELVRAERGPEAGPNPRPARRCEATAAATTCWPRPGCPKARRIFPTSRPAPATSGCGTPTPPWFRR
ncbi:Uncharacterised protein [Chromobacterium violaceum]|uniref:Uncharacterized protein n=1 Tax=Chromobacterium violaceum TaxID=536 RepID=A0A3S4LN25_CHRVL|nr:Uncharacterised protein [Chromobacterium violaceum]